MAVRGCRRSWRVRTHRSEVVEVQCWSSEVGEGTGGSLELGDMLGCVRWWSFVVGDRRRYVIDGFFLLLITHQDAVSMREREREWLMQRVTEVAGSTEKKAFDTMIINKGENRNCITQYY